MTNEAGPLQRIAKAVGSAVQAVAAGAGLTSEPEVATPESKSARKARQKATIARVEETVQAEQAAKKRRRSR